MSFDLSQFAKRLGWLDAGVAEPVVDEETKDKYLNWVAAHQDLDMKYLSRRQAERVNPQKYLSSAQSVLCFALYYFPGWAHENLKCSNYSWGDDYHKVLKEKLEATILELQKIFGSFEYKVCVDTAPVHEKYFAAKAGLGWQGKNTLLLHREGGSQIFLGEILSSLPLSYFQAALPMTNHCGTCRRCIEACPTEALQEYKLDAHRCISYWNLEHRRAFSESTPGFHGWIAGCDICQEVCPWNSKLVPVANAPREPRGPIKKGALSYIPAENWPRNIQQASVRNE